MSQDHSESGNDDPEQDTPGKLLWRLLKYSAIALLVVINVAGILCIGLQWRRLQRETHLSQARGCLGGIRLALANYHFATGDYLPRVLTAENGKKVSWRVIVAKGMLDYRLGTEPFSIEELLNQADTKCPVNLRFPENHSDVRFTQAVAITSSADASSQMSETCWAVAFLRDSDIVWTEPRDLTVDEFEQVIRSRRCGESIPVLTSDGKIAVIESGGIITYYKDFSVDKELLPGRAKFR